jgi:hypothetical protein
MAEGAQFNVLRAPKHALGAEGVVELADLAQVRCAGLVGRPFFQIWICESTISMASSFWALALFTAGM